MLITGFILELFSIVFNHQEKAAASDTENCEI